METHRVSNEVPVSPDINAQEKRGIKRKAPADSSLQNSLSNLADFIAENLHSAFPDDALLLQCGSACPVILKSRPEVVLELCEQKLHTWPYKNVPACWRRMYEEASLWSVLRVLRQQIQRVQSDPRGSSDLEWFTQIVKLLDTAIQLTGSPARGEVLERVFQQLGSLVSNEAIPNLPEQFSVTPPTAIQTKQPIHRFSTPPDFEEFQAHLDRDNTPVIIKDAIEHWSARSHWPSPHYWMQRTLGGRRLVPVEVGSQYTDNAWSQRILSFKEFLTRYMLQQSNETGYLAQYDLFAQIPALRSDVQVPDFCYCSPPQPSAAATGNGKLEAIQQIDDPLMNLWLGPASTKTPLHTDPYSNILVQVMGYKYVRLYSPSETPKLYPMGVDENGVDMANTSSVDVCLARTEGVNGEKAEEQKVKFPLFEDAKFVEGHLGPGECLYIPQGWWHCVEGLSIGASVSFWWN